MPDGRLKIVRNAPEATMHSKSVLSASFMFGASSADELADDLADDHRHLPACPARWWRVRRSR